MALISLISEAYVAQIISYLAIESLSDPVLSDVFRLSDPTVGNRRIRHPTTSYRNPVPRNPTTSDRILSEVVGFLSEIVGLHRIPRRIRRDPTVGLFVLGCLIDGSRIDAEH